MTLDEALIEIDGLDYSSIATRRAIVSTCSSAAATGTSIWSRDNREDAQKEGPAGAQAGSCNHHRLERFRKGSVLRALEDLGYYAVDNMPVELIPKFAELIRDNPSIKSAALVVDVREERGTRALSRDLAQTARKPEGAPHLYGGGRRSHHPPLQRNAPPASARHGPFDSRRASARSARQLAPIRALADLIINTSKFTVHELRDFIGERFRGQGDESKIMVYVTSFGFRNGVPPDSDLVFDVRFLPNPNYIPRFKKLTGRNPAVAKYIRSFPQTVEFIKRISELLIYLLPHYIREGKSYLTIAFGCTGGQHRSVMMADEIRNNLQRAGYNAKVTHRDIK